MPEIQALAVLLPSEVCEGESPPCLFATLTGCLALFGMSWHVATSL